MNLYEMLKDREGFPQEQISYNNYESESPAELDEPVCVGMNLMKNDFIAFLKSVKQ